MDITIKNLRKRNKKVLRNAMLADHYLNQVTVSHIEEIDNADMFFPIISSFSTQFKSPLVQRFIAKKLGLQWVSKDEERGNYCDKDGHYYRVCCSFENDNDSLNVRQIRPWQNVDKYLCMYVGEDIEDTVFFEISNADMMQYVNEEGHYCHGTSRSNMNNANKEYAITFDVKDSRFIKKHKNDKIREVVLT